MTGIGIVGCGAISGIYLENLTRRFREARVVACADLVAERAKAQGVIKVVFDRGGYLYHGRVKALADAAREAGLEF